MDNFDTERFISEIQSRPSIWNSSAAEYSNRDLKRRDWEELVEIFGGDSVSASERKELGQDLQKRWKNLRGCYVREVKRQKDIKSGLGPGSRKSEYIYYKQLLFLQNVVAIRDADLQEESIENSPNEEETQNDAEKSLQKIKKLKTEQPNESVHLVRGEARNLTKYIEKTDRRETPEDDEDKMFLLSLLTSLKSVATEKKLTLKINIMSLIQEALQENPRGRPEFVRSRPHSTPAGASYSVDPGYGYFGQPGPSSQQIKTEKHSPKRTPKKIVPSFSNTSESSSDSLVELSD